MVIVYDVNRMSERFVERVAWSPVPVQNVLIWEEGSVVSTRVVMHHGLARPLDSR